jgi:diaminopimelate decarboxylase
VLDALDEVERAAAAGVGAVLVHVTPGIDADTHAAIRTAHHGSKFGLPPEQALEAIQRSLAAGPDVQGLHVHVGSQLLDAQARARASSGSRGSPPPAAQRSAGHLRSSIKGSISTAR